VVKKKKDNPLEGLTRFNVDPIHVPEANKILGMQHRLSAQEHDTWIKEHRTGLAAAEAKKKKPKYTQKEIMEGVNDSNDYLGQEWNARADYLEKGLVTPFQWAMNSSDRPSPINSKGEPKKPGEYGGDYYSYGIDVGEAPILGQDFGIPQPNKIPEWIGNQLSPWAVGDKLGTDTVSVRNYNSSKQKTLGDDGYYSTDSLENVKKAYELSKTGKVEEPALPQSLEKPVASKKKEPDYIPSQSEKDWKRGKWATPKQVAADKKKATKPMKPEEMDQLLSDVIAAGGSYKLEDGRESAPTAKKSDKKKAEPKKKDVVTQAVERMTPAETPKEKPSKAKKAEPAAETPKSEPVLAAQVPRSDSSNNIVDVDRFSKSKKSGYGSALPRVPTAEEDAEFNAKADEVTAKESAANAALDAEMAVKPSTTAKADTEKKSGGPYILNTDKTGKGSPITGTKSQAKGTAAVNQMRRNRESSIRPFNPAASTATQSTGKSTFYDISDDDLGVKGATPAATSKPSMSSRFKGFFGGDVKSSEPAAPMAAAPSASAPTSRSTPPAPAAVSSAPSYSRTQFFAGGHNVNQQGLGGQNINAFNDNSGGGGTPGKGGTGSINNNYATVQANVGDGNTYGNVKGATVGSPAVASTSGKASSTNKNATVLSTGGPAAHVRAPNAARTSRPTNTKANPRTKNP
jgi:hypothetical protein